MARSAFTAKHSTMDPIFLLKMWPFTYTRWSVSNLLVTDNMTVYLLILVTNLRKKSLVFYYLYIKTSFE